MRFGKWLVVAALSVAPLLLNSQSSPPSSGASAQDIDYHKPVYLKPDSIVCSYDVYMAYLSLSTDQQKDFHTIFSDADLALRKGAAERLKCQVSTRGQVRVAFPLGGNNGKNWLHFYLPDAYDNNPTNTLWISRTEDFTNGIDETKPVPDADKQPGHVQGGIDKSKRVYLKVGSALCFERILESATNNNDAFRADFAAVFGVPGDVRDAAMRKLGCGVWKGREEITIETLHYQKTDYVLFTFANPSDYHYNNVMMVTKLENIEN